MKTGSPMKRRSTSPYRLTRCSHPGPFRRVWDLSLMSTCARTAPRNGFVCNRNWLDSKGEDSTVKNKITTRTILLFLTALSSAIAQEKKDVIYQTAGPVAIAGAAGMFGNPVHGAPYSATITHECTQTLADGNRIVQKSSGMTARDSQGRTHQDAALPAIGNLSAANAPELVFIQDPVAQVSYTLNVTERTAQKMMALFP